MTEADEIAVWCGYNSAWDMLKGELDNEELLDLLNELLHDDTQKGSAIMLDWIKELATEKYEWFDHEQALADAEDAQYEAYREKMYYGED